MAVACFAGSLCLLKRTNDPSQAGLRGLGPVRGNGSSLVEIFVAPRICKNNHVAWEARRRIFRRQGRSRWLHQFFSFSFSLSVSRRNKVLVKRERKGSRSRDWFNFRISEIAKGITTHAARIRCWSKSKDIFRSNFWCSLSVGESYWGILVTTCYRRSIVPISILWIFNKFLSVLLRHEIRLLVKVLVHEWTITLCMKHSGTLIVK